MKKLTMKAGLLGALWLFGCGSEGGADMSAASDEGVWDIPGTPTEAEVPPDSPVAVVELGERHHLKFVRLPDTDTVFVSEKGEGTDVSALELVEAELAADGGHTAKDVFIALTESGVPIPDALESLDAAAREQGWALPLLEDARLRDVGYSNSTPACNNSSFTATTYGGIIAHNATWLDRHPWSQYSHYLGYWSGAQHYTPRVSATLERHNILQYRGKLCYEQMDCVVGQSCHTAVQGWGQSPTYLAPRISFQYRRPGVTSWTTADYEYVARGSTTWIDWAFFGVGNERWDWRMNTTGGQAQDWLDYMRSYYD